MSKDKYITHPMLQVEEARVKDKISKIFEINCTVQLNKMISLFKQKFSGY